MRRAQARRAAVACLGLGVVLLGLAALWFLVDALTGGVTTALAASPDPTLRPGGDTRTPGSGPGFVGQPLLAIAGVLGIGIASLVATLVYVRWSGGRRPDGPPGTGGRD